MRTHAIAYYTCAVTDPVEAWRVLLLAYDSALRAVEADVARHGAVPLTWYDVLLELAAVPTGLRMQEVAERVVLSRTRVSRLVEEMARAGLVERRPDDRDKRVTWACITDEGRAAMRETAPAYMMAIRQHFGNYLTEGDTRAVGSAMLKVARGHGRWLDGPPTHLAAPATEPSEYSGP